MAGGLNLLNTVAVSLNFLSLLKRVKNQIGHPFSPSISK
uniref:Uncharacterized protein n=1 Tax=Anguilla anguilla TaxID=7936 RepID=A0A0E9R3H6_ANGAN